MTKRRRIPRYQQKELEKGRIPADISQQAPHTSWCEMPLYYVDQEFTCRRCGKVEVWTAEQQKWWYETAKGYIFSNAIHCHDCRKSIRENHAGTPRKSHQDRRESGE
ncbi:MAG: zinc-ribbon domain containing protein [Planctomycetota bacterium]|nr:zinc-ribbon domain containing protein [Planctomycetota bacterium]